MARQLIGAYREHRRVEAALGTGVDAWRASENGEAVQQFLAMVTRLAGLLSLPFLRQLSRPRKLYRIAAFDCSEPRLEKALELGFLDSAAAEKLRVIHVPATTALPDIPDEVLRALERIVDRLTTLEQRQPAMPKPGHLDLIVLSDSRIVTRVGYQPKIELTDAEWRLFWKLFQLAGAELTEEMRKELGTAFYAQRTLRVAVNRKLKRLNVEISPVPWCLVEIKLAPAHGSNT